MTRALRVSSAMISTGFVEVRDRPESPTLTGVDIVNELSLIFGFSSDAISTGVVPGAKSGVAAEEIVDDVLLKILPKISAISTALAFCTL